MTRASSSDGYIALPSRLTFKYSPRLLSTWPNQSPLSSSLQDFRFQFPHSRNAPKHPHHGRRWLHVRTIPESSRTWPTQNYSGGSILADFISRKDDPIGTSSIFAAVRSTEQAQCLSKLDGVHVLQLELTEQAAVRDAVLNNEIDIVLHLAGWDLGVSKSFIDALGERKQATGSQTCFVPVNSLPGSESIKTN